MRRSLTILILILILFISFLLNAQTITITVDWDNSLREVPIDAYGVNSSANFIPSFSNNPIFMENLALVTQKKGLVRLHGWGMLGNSPEAWQENGVWNSEKIKQALSPLAAESYNVMINIPSGPLGEDDYQDPNIFAQFCADLVKIVNIDHKLGVKYWEIPNERESDFTNPGLSVNEMATLIQTAAQAMKSVDPSIKVGGPSAAWVNIDYLTDLIDAVYPNIDFVSCHTYSGDCSNSLQEAYNIAQNATADLATLRNRINELTTPEYLPIFLTEHNISFQGCSRIYSNEGAVYEAIILTESIAAGIDATNYWNVSPYSDMSFFDGDEVLSSAHIYKVFNQSFYGNLVQSQSSNNSKVIVYATSNQANNSRAFCLINRTSEPQFINFQFENWLPTNLNKHLFDADNDYLTSQINWSDLTNSNFFLSPYSVNLFVNDPTLSLSDADKNDNTIVFYPNPITEKLYLPNQVSNDIFTVFSLSGALVKKGVITSNFIDFSDLKTGIYFLKIKAYHTGVTKFAKLIKE